MWLLCLLPLNAAANALRDLDNIDVLDCAAAKQAKTRVHPTKLAGVSVQDKLKLVREDLKGAIIARSALTHAS